MRSTLLFLLGLLVSCTVPDKASLKVERETRALRKSPITLSATNHGKTTNDQIDIRENNSFEYRSQTRGTQKIVIYAGTFTQNGDTLTLIFHDNHKEDLWTDKAVIDKSTNKITILAKDTSFNKELTIGGKK